jgi:hypothetical protein
LVALVCCEVLRTISKIIIDLDIENIMQFPYIFDDLSNFNNTMSQPRHSAIRTRKIAYFRLHSILISIGISSTR